MSIIELVGNIVDYFRQALVWLFIIGILLTVPSIARADACDPVRKASNVSPEDIRACVDELKSASLASEPSIFKEVWRTLTLRWNPNRPVDDLPTIHWIQKSFDAAFGAACNQYMEPHPLSLSSDEDDRVACMVQMEEHHEVAWKQISGIAGVNLNNPATAEALNRALVFESSTSPVPDGTGAACAEYIRVPTGDPRRTTAQINGIYRPTGGYAELAQNCILEISKEQPIAWKALTTLLGEDPANPFTTLRGDDRVNPSDITSTLPEDSTWVEIALMASSPHACDRYRGSSYDPTVMGLDEEKLVGAMSDVVFKARRACWARIEITRPKAFEGHSFNIHRLPNGRDLFEAVRSESFLDRAISAINSGGASSSSTPSSESPSGSPRSWLSYFGIDSGNVYGAVVKTAFVWWLFVTTLRLAWCIPGRRLGLYNPDHFWLWSWLWPWRPLYRFARKGLPFVREGKQGKEATGRWAPFLETMSLVFKPGHIFLGRLRWRGIPLFQPIGIDGSAGGGHLAMISSSGTGKTTLLMTMLGLHRGNAFVVDCDAQMINAVGRRLGKGGKGLFGRGNQVCVLDPHSIARDMPGSSWNAIEEMDRYIKEHGMDRAVEFAQTIAEALIREEEEGENNVWVARDARLLIRGLVLYVFLQKTNRNLPEVRRLLMLGLDREVDGKRGIQALILDMRRYREFGGAIAAGAAELDKSDGKNYALSSTKGQTLWLDFPLMQKICGHSDFDLHDLVGGRLCVFVCAPVTDVQKKLSGYFRLLTMLSMEAFQQWKGSPPKRRCLFAIDEMPALGHIDVIQTSASTFRKYNVRLLCIAQDIPRLKKVYPEGWSGFLSDAAASIWMGVSPEDKETMETLQLGLTQSTRQEALESGLFSDVSGRMQKVERPIIYPNQLKEFFTAGGVVVIRNGRNPLRLQNSPYYKELPVFFYDRDTIKFGERIGRRIGRWICCRLITGPGLPDKSASREQERKRSRTDTHTHQANESDFRTRTEEYREPTPTRQPPPRREEEKQQTRGHTVKPNEDGASNRKHEQTSTGDQSKRAEPLFVMLFTDCFDKTNGEYPHPRSRTIVWDGFQVDLNQTIGFKALQFRFEEWVAFNFRGDEKARGEHIITFFEDYIKAAADQDQENTA